MFINKNNINTYRRASSLSCPRH